MNNTGNQEINPITRLDYPDPDVIRVDNTYYMVSTTMHFMPLLLRMCRALSKRRKTCQTDRGSSSFRDPSERRELSFSG